MRTDNKLWRNRKAKKELARRLQSENPGLEVVHPHAAGIDVGNSAHYAAVRPDRDSQPVRRFECFTADLHCLADWLQNCGVKTVALRLSHPQRSSLLVKQRSMRVPQGMPIDQSESRLLRSRMELASPQTLGVEWRTLPRCKNKRVICAVSTPNVVCL